MNKSKETTTTNSIMEDIDLSNLERTSRSTSRENLLELDSSSSTERKLQTTRKPQQRQRKVRRFEPVPTNDHPLRRLKSSGSTDSLVSDVEAQQQQHHSDEESIISKDGSRGTLRDQSHLLSILISKKTELYKYNKVIPGPPPPKDEFDEVDEDISTTGCAYWAHALHTAKEHGGKYNERLQCALRTALGSFLTFAILVFPQQDILGCVWIGNICYHANIKDSFGSALTSSIAFGRSVILTTAITWPVAFFLAELTTTQGCILLPFVTFLLTFFIMSCPQLASRNLMILVMYIVLASPVRDENIAWWEPFGWVASYLVSLVIAILMNIFPFPNFALTKTHKLLRRLEKDLTMLLLETKAYSDHTGDDTTRSRSAIASIEMMHTRLCKTINDLKKMLPASKTELSWICKKQAANDLNEWVLQSEKLLKPLKMLRSALMQRVLGEDNTHDVLFMKQIIREQVSSDRDRLVDAMIAAIAVCHAWADPSEHRTVLPDVQAELHIALHECRNSFHIAMTIASEGLDSMNPQDNVPVFAHLTRRTASFSALFALGDTLLSYLENHSWQQREESIDFDNHDDNINNTNNNIQHNGPVLRLVSYATSIMGFWEQEWLWHKTDSFRLALKTAFGMVIASMFISIPYLWEISDPFGVWPGLTIASVNLVTTGSSFHKAFDRLFGTLLAAAYALLCTDLFPGNKDYIKIPVITIFTFILVYFRNANHAYKYTYAATSIGSMLYGSIKNDFNFYGYIPKRIELIFTGVIIFSIVELLVFPRSSRTIVENSSLEFFINMQNFLKQAMDCTKRMDVYITESNDNNNTATDYTNQLFNENDDPFHLKKLQNCLKKVTTNVKTLQKELDSALDEPDVGLTLPLHGESFRGLVKIQTGCETQATLLLNALERLGNYYQQQQEKEQKEEQQEQLKKHSHQHQHHIRRTSELIIMNWPQVHTMILDDVTQTINYTCDWLTSVYRDKHIRPQKNGNSVQAVSAAASFRTLEECRLRIINIWSKSYQEFISLQGFERFSDPVAIMTIGITTSLILEICRHMQKAGKHLEEIAYNFPAQD